MPTPSTVIWTFLQLTKSYVITIVELRNQTTTPDLRRPYGDSLTHSLLGEEEQEPPGRPPDKEEEDEKDEDDEEDEEEEGEDEDEEKKEEEEETRVVRLGEIIAGTACIVSGTTSNQPE
ncbi:hypothetical protein SprV_0902770500 [Sparganum proliferum]